MRAKRTGAPGGAGFSWLGRLVVRHPVMIIAAWLAIAAAMLLLLPSLTKVANKNPPQFLPSDAPVLVAGQAMEDAFHEFDSDNMVLIVLSNEQGLSPADEGTYRTLVDRLRADTADVLTVDDFVHTPELRQVMTSPDQKAWNLPVSLTGGIGTAEGQQSYRNVVQIVDDTTANSSLKVHRVGAPATFDDVSKIGARDQHLIEIATVLMVLAILILVYRNLVAMLLPIATIGVSLVVAQQAVAGLGELGLGVGPQTMVLMTAMMIGAGTDYAIFLLSRYHECLRNGLSSDAALETALKSIGKVIAGSAATVAVAFLGMAFTELAVFSTVGPALAVTVFFAFLASTTLLPALIVLAGRRGWVQPRRDLTGRFWRRSGIHIVRRPRMHLAASLVVLLGLAGCATLVNFNFDDRKSLPVDAPSNVAFDAMKQHFPEDPSAQLFVLIESPRDLRTPKALADLERMAQRITQLPDIASVRGITRPTGEVLEEAKATAQAGEVGSRLEQASTLIADNDANLSMLTGGADQLADTLGQIRGSVLDAVITIRPLATALADMQRQYGGSKTLDEVDKTAKLVANMRSLGEALDANLARVANMYTWAVPMVSALNASPQCNADPGCVAGRADLRQVIAAGEDGALTRLSDLVRQLKGTQGTDTLDEAVRGLGISMDSAISAARDLGLGDPDGIERQLNSLQEGANQLADGSRQLAEGVQLLVDQTRVMGSGLDQASAFLLGMKRDAADPAMSGFYVPPQILTQDEFKKAASLFVSTDGRMVRYLVQTALDPFSTAAMDQMAKIRETVDSARPNTALADSSVSMLGATGFNYDLRNYYDKDIKFIIGVTLIVVFLILVLLLKAIVAPLYLVLSVILSCMSAVGIGVILFQFILGQEIAWNLPGAAFLVLVAVGADYNLLLVSRVRDEAHLGLRSAVIRTVGATGGVITSAGLIFAASMLGLTLSSINTVVQLGFVIGVGLLLDTFLVRTVTVPAMAVLAGNANWWPSKFAGGKRPVKRRERLPGAAATQLAAAAAREGSVAGRVPIGVDATSGTSADTKPEGQPNSLADFRFDDVAAVQLAQANQAMATWIARALGYSKVAVCDIEPSAVTVVVVDTGTEGVRGVIAGMHDSDDLSEWLTAAFDRSGLQPEILFLVSSQGDCAGVRAHLKAAMRMPVFDLGETQARNVSYEEVTHDQPRSTSHRRTLTKVAAFGLTLVLTFFAVGPQASGKDVRLQANRMEANPGASVVDAHIVPRLTVAPPVSAPQAPPVRPMAEPPPIVPVDERPATLKRAPVPARQTPIASAPVAARQEMIAPPLVQAPQTPSGPPPDVQAPPPPPTPLAQVLSPLFGALP